MSKMTLSRALDINGAIVACFMGVGEKEVDQLPDCSLSEMLEASAIVRAENEKEKRKEDEAIIRMVVADRGIAALYTLTHYHTTHQTAEEFEPIVVLGSVGLFNIELTEG